MLTIPPFAFLLLFANVAALFGFLSALLPPASALFFLATADAFCPLDIPLAFAAGTHLG